MAPSSSGDKTPGDGFPESRENRRLAEGDLATACASSYLSSMAAPRSSRPEEHQFEFPGCSKPLSSTKVVPTPSSSMCVRHVHCSRTQTEAHDAYWQSSSFRLASLAVFVAHPKGTQRRATFGARRRTFRSCSSHDDDMVLSSQYSHIEAHQVAAGLS